MFRLEVMSVKEGHEQHDYNPNDRKDVKRIIELIMEKLKNGWNLYAAKKGGDFVKIADKNSTVGDVNLNQTLEDLDRFMLTEDRKLLAAPVMGGSVLKEGRPLLNPFEEEDEKLPSVVEQLPVEPKASEILLKTKKKQIRGALYDTKGFCAVGVLFYEAALEYYYCRGIGGLGPVLETRFGFPERIFMEIMTRNDSLGQDFAQIGEWLASQGF